MPTLPLCHIQEYKTLCLHVPTSAADAVTMAGFEPKPACGQFTRDLEQPHQCKPVSGSTTMQWNGAEFPMLRLPVQCDGQIVCAHNKGPNCVSGAGCLSWRIVCMPSVNLLDPASKPEPHASHIRPSGLWFLCMCAWLAPSTESKGDAIVWLHHAIANAELCGFTHCSGCGLSTSVSFLHNYVPCVCFYSLYTVGIVAADCFKSGDESSRGEITRVMESLCQCKPPP